jgi:hypothetical protein
MRIDVNNIIIGRVLSASFEANFSLRLPTLFNQYFISHTHPPKRLRLFASLYPTPVEASGREVLTSIGWVGWEGKHQVNKGDGFGFYPLNLLPAYRDYI